VSEGDRGDIRRRLRAVEQDAAAAASFNALRADFVDLSSLGDHVDRGFIEMRGMFDATAAGQQQIVDLIQSLIDGQDR
jgi:hypothetical protein